MRKKLVVRLWEHFQGGPCHASARDDSRPAAKQRGEGGKANDNKGGEKEGENGDSGCISEHVICTRISYTHTRPYIHFDARLESRSRVGGRGRSAHGSHAAYISIDR